MSTSPKFSDSKATDKADFSQTCTRLSQYLKDNKASFGDLSFTQSDSGFSFERSPAMNLFPQHTGFGNSSSDVASRQTHEPTTKAGEGKQMTIIYGGNVVVFDDMLAEKVKEVLVLANHASAKSHPTMMRSNSFLDLVRCPIPTSVSNPPQTRNASLRLFLEKRKERIKARAPYQVNAPAAATMNAKPDETKAWLGLSSP